jgi:hypothetical protein
MSHRPSTTDLSADALTRALRDLPPATPPGDGWTMLAASLRSHGLVRDDDGAADDDTSQPARNVVTHATARAGERRVHARTPRRPWLVAGIAAALALAAIVLVPANTVDRTTSTPTSQPNTGSITPPSANAAAANELAELRSESSRIEEWLRTLKADETPLDGRSLMAATEIEDMIGLIDLQLAAGNDTGSDTQALWRGRVELLRDLATVRTTYSLAGTGIAANGAAAMPDNWTHL